MIESVLPPAAASADVFGEVDAELYPEERVAVANAVARRRAEFTTVRWCARQALGDLGITAGPIVAGVRGAPLWPPSIVGSMTHCEGYRAAAVAHHSAIAALGIDAEINAPLPAGVAQAVASADELRRLPALGEIAADRLLFSAKESLYKAWFPATGRFLDFDEAEIRVIPDGSFVATVTAALPPDAPVWREVHGRWSAHARWIVTAVFVPGAGSGP